MRRRPHDFAGWLIAGLLLVAAALMWLAIAALWAGAASRAVPPVY